MTKDQIRDAWARIPASLEVDEPGDQRDPKRIGFSVTVAVSWERQTPEEDHDTAELIQALLRLAPAHVRTLIRSREEETLERMRTAVEQMRARKAKDEACTD